MLLFSMRDEFETGLLPHSHVKRLFSFESTQDFQARTYDYDTDEGWTDAGESMSIQTGTTGLTSPR